jgi:hypothetical protein
MADGDFPCHKTVDYSDGEGGQITENSKRCTGAAIFLENVRPGGLRSNVQFRLAVAFGEIKLNRLSDRVPVYGSIGDFINGASG